MACTVHTEPEIQHRQPSRAASRRHAFTLVEVMVVVLILGMLLAVAVPQFFKARDRSRATACQHNMVEILGAKERWAMDNERGATDTPSMSDLVVPGVYLKTMPVCASGGTYDVGRMDELPICSIGGVRGEVGAHVLQ